MATKTARSELTLAAIVDVALHVAAAEGLESLSIGRVAKRLGLSKSGVFSRVGSREQLQLAVIEEFDRRFTQDVFLPALQEPRGLARLRSIMSRWLSRSHLSDRGSACLYSAAAFEWDDRTGPVRARILAGVLHWRQLLRRSVQQAIQTGELRADTDIDQLVFEIDSLGVAFLRDHRFIRDPDAAQRVQCAFDRLIASCEVTA